MNYINITIRYFFIFLFFIVSIGIVQAQKIVRASGSAQVRQERNMTFEDATNLAIEKAKINAIESVFGTYVEQQTDMTIEDGITSYNIIGTTRVKGEWIETINDPQIKTINRKEDSKFGKQDVIYVKCNIKGKVRKVRPRAMLKYEILNSPNVQSRSSDFIEGEQLYLYFKSPVDGFLSIFLEDDEAVYRLLPYANMRSDNKNGVHIQSDIGYLFFSPDHNSFTKSLADEMIMTLTKDRVEYNYVYIVFSHEKYIKPSLQKSHQTHDKIIPASLSHHEFESWISNNKISSESFQVIKKKIGIKKKVGKR